MLWLVLDFACLGPTSCVATALDGRTVIYSEVKILQIPFRDTIMSQLEWKKFSSLAISRPRARHLLLSQNVIVIHSTMWNSRRQGQPFTVNMDDLICEQTRNSPGRCFQTGLSALFPPSRLSAGHWCPRNLWKASTPRL